ncbi:MAG: hypothetical protein KatS3mg088_468 [Patescibacteria group bacterium]|nr:MAG: hypothetical protein KatS3mg088_468 [Patescibacteria group bacterium]
MFNLSYLTFSDAAKFADLARNFVLGRGWGSSFSFFSPSIFQQLEKTLFDMGIFPLTPFFISLSFRIFGISDFAVIATSFFFYVLSLVFTFLLSRKIFKSSLIGFLSLLVVGFNLNLIDYATSGASEALFIAEILLLFYLLSFKKKVFDLFSLLVIVLMYFTRAHAFIFIAGALLFWLLLRFDVKKSLFYFSFILILGLLFDRFVLSSLSGKFFIYSILGGGKYAVLQHNSSWAVSDTLRGLPRQSFDLISVLKKVFYNLYNFYKLMPQIMNPYLFALFLIGLFAWGKDRLQNSFKIASLFMVFLTFLVAAASIPFFRYIHPVVPLVYILAVGTLVEIISKLEILNSKLKISKQKLVIFSSLFLILFFGVGQSVGVLLLDRRFERRVYNFDKPPVYVLLSKIIKENTDPNEVILTNLDTWGSWYGERRTVWFPLTPKQIINPENGKIPFDAIYLTSYKMDDPNYYMGNEWRLIFENPQSPEKWNCEGCDQIAKEFTLKGVYKVIPDDDYERQGEISIILVKN